MVSPVAVKKEFFFRFELALIYTAMLEFSQSFKTLR